MIFPNLTDYLIANGLISRNELISKYKIDTNFHERGFAYIFLLIVAVLIGIAGIGYFAYKNGQVKFPQKTHEVTPIPSDVPNKTLNWETYINQEFDFCLNYPGTWMLKRAPGELNSGNLASLHSNKLIATPVKDETAKVFTITIGYFKNIQDLEFDKWLVETYNLSTDTEINFTVEELDNLRVYKTESVPGQRGYLFAFITENDTEYAALGLTPYNSSDPYPLQTEHLEIFDQILSTFRFTN